MMHKGVFIVMHVSGLVMHKGMLIVMLIVVLIVVLIMVLLVMHIDRLLVMLNHQGLLVNDSGRLLLDKQSGLLIDYVVFLGLNVLMGHNLLIFMKLLWSVLIIMILRLQLLVIDFVFVHIPALRLLIFAVFFSVRFVVTVVGVTVAVV